MKTKRLTWLVSVLAVLALSYGAASAQVTLVVDDDGFGSASNCDDATTPAYPTINLAIAAAAASGDTIVVCPGTYVEQVVISSKKLRLVGNPGAIITATPGAVGAMVDVSAATVAMSGFILEGNSGAGRGGCQAGPSRFSGIRFHDQASGAITHNVVRNVHLPVPLLGCQEGVGIEIRDLDDSDGTATVAVTDNTVVAYQKGGIVVNGEGATARVANNVVVGFGPTAAIAQNGIQIGVGAAAAVDGNYIQGNFYSPGTFASAGILIFGFQKGTNTQIPNSNVFVENQVDVLRGPVCGQCVQ
jgi:hypothetical protein